MSQTHNIQLANFYEASFVSNRQDVELVKLDLSDDSSQCFQAPPGLCEISFVDLKPDEFFYAAALRSDGGISDPEKRIEHRLDS